MKAPPRFLSVDDVITLHAIAIEDQAGDPTIRDRNLLESAVAAPAQQFASEYLHPDIPSIAAAYAFHICKNHPFIDGNKRAGTAAMIAFLSDNGWSFEASADDAEPVILDLAAGRMDKATFTNWATAHMHEKPSLELRDFFAKLQYKSIAETLRAGLPHDDPARAHRERVDTMAEAGRAIPAIREANLGAADAEAAGDHQAATILRGQAHLLTAIYRIAQDSGYEW